MSRNFEIYPSLPFQWVKMNSNEVYTMDLHEHCNVDFLKKHLESQSHDIKVVSAELNDTGRYQEPGMLFGVIRHTEETDLPAYYRIVLTKKMHGGRVATITVHLPLVWNERFLGISGGGSASFMDYQQYLFASCTPWTIAIRNHFVCAQTDCGIGFDNYTWGHKDDSDEPDWELLKAWGYEAAHDVSVIGKRVATLVYGKEPAYSYIQGISAGGRTVHGEVQHYPTDYDGAWAECAAAPWIGHLLSQSWPYFVMLHEQHTVSKAKVESFYHGMLRKYGCEDKGYLDSCYIPDFDPYSMVGEETATGTITEEDARIMQLIYDGPHYMDGRSMPKCGAMGSNIRYAGFLDYDEAGLQPKGVLSLTALQSFRWLLHNRNLQFKDITREDFDRMYDLAISSFAVLDNQDPDIRPFFEHGGKLMLTHATSDQCVPLANTLNYHSNVLRYIDREDADQAPIACYVSKGGGHGETMGIGELMSYPHVWAALMLWVEEGKTPDTLPTQIWNATTQCVELTGKTEKQFIK
jgi:feruloyl esterase